MSVKTLTFFFFMVMAAPFFLRGSVVLKEIYNPNKIDIANGKLYVAQGTEFYMYSLKELSLIKQFGRVGEGPGELMANPYVFNDINVNNGNITVSGQKKITCFSESGDFKSEAKKNRQYFKMVPFANQYVVNSFLDNKRDQGNIYSRISLVDASGNELKELYKQKSELGGSRSRENGAQILPLFADTPHFAIWQNRLFVEDSIRGLVVHVFDEHGERIELIKIEGLALPVTDHHRAQALQAIRYDKTIDAAVKQSGGWENFQKKYDFIFPDFFPMASDIVVDRGHLYLQTFESSDDRTVYLVVDLMGRTQKKVLLPTVAPAPFTAILVGQEFRLYKIHEGVFYYLQENEDQETWSFCAEKI